MSAVTLGLRFHMGRQRLGHRGGNRRKLPIGNAAHGQKRLSVVVRFAVKDLISGSNLLRRSL